MKANSSDLFLLNNTGNKSKETLIETFVVREDEFNTVFSDLQEARTPEEVGNTLVIGLRGAGKTTLLHRLKYAVEDDAVLSTKFLPIIFKEEQYHLSDLATLWESLAQYLEEIFKWKGIVRKMDEIIEQDGFSERELFQVIESELDKRGECVLLFFENLNVFLGKLALNERATLKDILTSKKILRLIASSTSYTDTRIDFLNDFYSFFKLVTLQGLSKTECEKLLIKIGALYGYEDQIRHIINNHPSRIESLRRLTGGVPRTISYLFQIFLDNSNGKAIKDLYILIDTLTFLYKAELDQLSPQQQKVIDVIARKWDAMPVKEITRQTRLESKNVSTILAGLEKNQLVEVIKTNTKNNLYRIKERFLNIWYLMRFGRKHDRNNVVWLVRFFDAWCDETELAKRVREHINDLSQGRYDEEAAVDMGNTFLSCENLSQSMKIQLLEATKSVLGDRMYRKLQPSGKLLSSVFESHVQAGNYDLALQSLEEMSLRDIERFGLLSYLYLSKKDFEKSAEYAKQVLELDSDNAAAALTLGIIHEENLRDIPQAKYYYEQAITAKSMHPYAASRLGDLVYKYENDLDKAREYHTLAIKKGLKRSYLFLGKILRDEQEYEEAEMNFQNAESSNVEGIYLELAKLYAEKRENKKALKYFQKSIDKNEENSLIDFGNWYRYRNRPQYAKAIELFEMAIKKNQMAAYSALGELYADDLKDYDKAIAVLTEGVLKNDANSAHELGHIYLDLNKPELAMTQFLKSFELGRKSALFCLAEGLYGLGFNNKKKQVLRTLIDHSEELKNYVFFELLLAKILLWNDQVTQSIEKFAEWMQTVMQDTIAEQDETDEPRLKPMIRELSNYFMLLIAKGYHHEAYRLFGGNGDTEIKTILRPVYFALMEDLKKDFPLEYLKAGDEYTDTIKEIRVQIQYIKKRVLN
jgi:tetratricopeptide (TPR) repeat protein